MNINNQLLHTLEQFHRKIKVEKMEEEGQLYEEDGSCLVRLCRCCCTDILSDEEEEKGKKLHVKNERGVKKTKILKSVKNQVKLAVAWLPKSGLNTLVYNFQNLEFS